MPLCAPCQSLLPLEVTAASLSLVITISLPFLSLSHMYAYPKIEYGIQYCPMLNFLYVEFRSICSVVTCLFFLLQVFVCLFTIVNLVRFIHSGEETVSSGYFILLRYFVVWIAIITPLDGLLGWQPCFKQYEQCSCEHSV